MDNLLPPFPLSVDCPQKKGLFLRLPIVTPNILFQALNVLNLDDRLQIEEMDSCPSIHSPSFQDSSSPTFQDYSSPTFQNYCSPTFPTFPANSTFQTFSGSGYLGAEQQEGGLIINSMPNRNIKGFYPH